jgi:N-acetylmuramoyl-L-alanine amidase
MKPIHYLFFCVLLFGFQGKPKPKKKNPVTATELNTPKPEHEYLRVQVTESATVENFLHKYRLDFYESNIKQFMVLNNVARNATIKKGSLVKIPILLYTYNDKSIRTSLNTTDLNLAQKVQAYNSDALELHIRPLPYATNKILWVPYNLINAKTETTRDQSKNVGLVGEGSEKANKTRTYAIFGQKYEKVPLIDQKLKGRIYYVEGGHGGPDPGAQSKVAGHTLSEDEYAYDVSLRVARNIISHGGTVYIINRDPNDGIRDGEYLLNDIDEITYPDLIPPRNHKERLFQRSDAVNLLYDKFNKKGLQDQRLIVIHVDSRGVNQKQDVFFYYQSANAKSKTIAEGMHKILKDKYAKFREYSGTVTTRDLHMLRECKPNTVYVELGNIRNARDLKRIMLAKNRQAIANWLYEGFVVK